MDRVEILLKEYEICHEDSNALGSRFWSFANIFIPTNLALLGLLLSVILNKTDIKFFPLIILIIGLFAIGILICVILWFKRTNSIQQFNYDRAREIEIELGMWKNRRLHAIDYFENNRFKSELISPDTTSILLEYHKKRWWEKKKERYRFLRPHIGSISVRIILYVLIALWVVLIVCGFVLPIHHHPCSIPFGY